MYTAAVLIIGIVIGVLLARYGLDLLAAAYEGMFGKVTRDSFKPDDDES